MSFEEFLYYASQEVVNLFPFLDIPWGPYFEVTRIHQPNETIMAVLLYSVGLTHAVSLSWPLLQPKELLPLASKCVLWIFIIRHALCAFKGAVDYEYDKHVRRRRSRPVARGALTPDEAFNFSVVQLLLGTGVLASLPNDCHGLGVISTLVMMLYPYGKRFTSFPQLIMGFGFAVSVFMASMVIGIDVSPGSEHFVSTLYMALVSMHIVTIANVIYSYQDMRDDAKAGIKSMPLVIGDRPKMWLSMMTAATEILLWKVGNRNDYSILYYIISCGGSFFLLSVMLALVDLRVAADCEWWFRRGAMGSVAVIVSGLYLEYVIRLLSFSIPSTYSTL
ncbi:prenyltransferase, putative [Talaromyces stipitatus ATCC 10500]|uniref:Prenyltransferase, putative n=1 Tax=Talaromyces stipitatus (strain ATCC 10500 / CBS 375.48 / QM 6759 / NRRL 1006) TaxID=441959 RepID=B8MGD3_TALSN|nr:prenyltransferase, putative [Talaromyces stipitatus ATCC 10500]EED16253.1 prenyltransferase, putative [Talaromyces stipitatus ATCC 10500]